MRDSGALLTRSAYLALDEDDRRLDEEAKEAARAARRESEGPQAIADAQAAVVDLTAAQEFYLDRAGELVGASQGLVACKTAYREAASRCQKLGITDVPTAPRFVAPDLTDALVIDNRWPRSWASPGGK